MFDTLRTGPRSQPVQPGRIVAALDLGSAKTCCLIAAVETAHPASGHGPRLRALGFGHQRSQGIEAGAVVDLELAQQAIVAALEQAEQSAGVRVEAVHVGINCGAPRSTTFNGQVALAEGRVTAADMERLDQGARDFAARVGRAPLAINRILLGLDGSAPVRKPIGLSGRMLWSNQHAVTVEAGPLRNIELLLEACDLDVAGAWPAAYASALAVTSEEERRLGVAVIDIGAAITSIAAFADGHFVLCDSLPFAGQHMTHYLSAATGIPLAEAERIKTLYGSLAGAYADELELVAVDQSDGRDLSQPVVVRGDLHRLLSSRFDWLLTSVRSRLDATGIDRLRTASVVLTGGTSQTQGLERVAGAVLGCPVRAAAPPAMAGIAGKLSGGVGSPAFSCVVGLAMEAGRPSAWISAAAHSPPPSRGYLAGYLGRVERWLKESF